MSVRVTRRELRHIVLARTFHVRVADISLGRGGRRLTLLAPPPGRRHDSRTMLMRTTRRINRHTMTQYFPLSLSLAIRRSCACIAPSRDCVLSTCAQRTRRSDRISYAASGVDTLQRSEGGPDRRYRRACDSGRVSPRSRVSRCPARGRPTRRGAVASCPARTRQLDVPEIPSRCSRGLAEGRLIAHEQPLRLRLARVEVVVVDLSWAHCSAVYELPN